MILHSNHLNIKPLSLSELKTYIRSRNHFERLNSLSVTNEELADAYCEEIMETISSHQQAWQNKNTDYLFFTLWLIIEKKSNTIVGQFTFNGKPNSEGEVEIFFSIDEQHRRKGFGFEATEAILKWASENELFKVVLVEAFRENDAAKASLKKLGFHKIITNDDDPPSSKYYKVVTSKKFNSSDLDFDE